jgi:hypothetical protein
MILAFVDEMGDAKFKDYFGLCCALINSNFYRKIKQNFQKILISEGWNPSIEFKGACLFSATSGDTSIPVEKRIAITSKILSLNTSDQNARMKFAYVKKTSTDTRRDYLGYLPRLLEKALPRAKKGSGKDILSLHCDFRKDITAREIYEAVNPVVAKRGYTLFEDIVVSVSSFHTVGILYADLVGYLCARVDTISKDSELFENIPPDQWDSNGKIRKWKSSTKLLESIKKFDQYEVSVK